MQTTATFPKVITNDPAYTFESYIPAQEGTIKDVVSLTRAECRDNCEVLALSWEYASEEDDRTTGRFAVCRPVACEDWGKIETGEIVVYTELFRWAKHAPEIAETQYKGEVGAFCTHVGPIARFDTKRDLLYAAAWDTSCGSNTPEGYDGEDIFEMYVVERFVEIG